MKLQLHWRGFHHLCFADAVILAIDPDQNWAPPRLLNIWSFFSRFFWPNWSWILTHYFMKDHFDARCPHHTPHTTHHFLFKWVRPRSVRWVENHGSQVLLVRVKFKGTVSSVVVTHQPHPPKDPRSSGGGICRVVKRMIRGVSSLSFSKISVSESKVYWPMIH